MDTDMCPDQILGVLSALCEGVEALSADGVADRLGLVRQAQALLETSVVVLGRRADELAAIGASGRAADVFLGVGAVRGRTARAEARRSQLLARAPEVGAALVEAARSGRPVGPDHLDSLARHTAKLSDDELAAVDLPAALSDAKRLPADTFDAAMRKRVADSVPAEPARTASQRRQASNVRHWFDDHAGMGHVHAELDPERYEAVAGAIDQHTASVAATSVASDGGSLTKDANLAATAFVELITASGAPRTARPQVTLVVEASTGRAETGHGHALCAEAATRLRCDAVEQRVVVDGAGLPINVGRKYRTATDSQWTAIRSLYSTCAWAGCQRPLMWCQLHHIHPWSEGGATDLDNLVPLCSEHHHQVHEGRWTIALRADRSLAITRPDGNHHGTTRPPRRFTLTHHDHHSGAPPPGGFGGREAPSPPARQPRLAATATAS